jgi:cell division protein ZapA
MKATPGGVTINILGKELMVACPDDEREALLAAARELDQRMRSVADGGKVVGGERVAVMTALNLSNDLLQCRQNGSAVPGDLDTRLVKLTERVEAALRG